MIQRRRLPQKKSDQAQETLTRPQCWLPWTAYLFLVDDHGDLVQNDVENVVPRQEADHAQYMVAELRRAAETVLPDPG